MSSTVTGSSSASASTIPDVGMDNARSMLPYLKNSSEKYDVLYVNTPWSKLDADTIAKVPVKDMSAENSALFMWVDSYSVDKGISLLNNWGFKFHSVYQVADVAQYPWMKKEKKPASTSPAPPSDPTTASTTAPPTESMDVADASAPVAEEPKDKVKTVRATNKKTRAPPITAPKWWVDSPETSCGSRPSSEQLWLATKGDVSLLFNSGTLAYQVVNLPELGKKSRAKKNMTELDWDVERPSVFLETVLGGLTPSRNVLNLFASSFHEKVDSWGPGLPGGFLHASSKNTGLVGEINKTMRAMKKTQLQTLSSKSMKYMATTDVAEKKSIMESMSDSWSPIETSVANLSMDIAYNMKTDSGEPSEWFVSLVQVLASKNVTDFSSLRKKRKKRQGPVDPDRPRHGIACASKISKELAEFLKMDPDEKIARTAVVSKLNEYIAEKGLQNPDNKLQILLDEPLKKLLKPPPGFEPVTYFNLCKLFGAHFPKKTDEEKKADKLARDKLVAEKKKEAKGPEGSSKKAKTS